MGLLDMTDPIMAGITGIATTAQAGKQIRNNELARRNLDGLVTEDPNPYLAMGGAVPSVNPATMQNDAQPDGVPYRGPSHEQGGIPVDGQGDVTPPQSPEQTAEVEGGEVKYTFPDGTVHVFSDRLTDPASGKTFADRAEELVAQANEPGETGAEARVELDRLRRSNEEQKAKAEAKQQERQPEQQEAPVTPVMGMEASQGMPGMDVSAEAMAGLPMGAPQAGQPPMMGFGGLLGERERSGEPTPKPMPVVVGKPAQVAQDNTSVKPILPSQGAKAPTTLTEDLREYHANKSLMDRVFDYFNPTPDPDAPQRLENGGDPKDKSDYDAEAEAEANKPVRQRLDLDMLPSRNPINTDPLASLPRVYMPESPKQLTFLERLSSKLKGGVDSIKSQFTEERDSAFPGGQFTELGVVTAQALAGGEDVPVARNPYMASAKTKLDAVRPVSATALRNQARLEANAQADGNTALGTAANRAIRQSASATTARTGASAAAEVAQVNNQSLIQSGNSVARLGEYERNARSTQMDRAASGRAAAGELARRAGQLSDSRQAAKAKYMDSERAREERLIELGEQFDIDMDVLGYSGVDGQAMAREVRRRRLERLNGKGSN